jgi:DNA-directed RNA polymerase subunit RPC12/RpoP
MASRPRALFKENDTQYNCPSCAAPLPKTFRSTRLVACENCRSVLHLSHGEVDELGKQAALAEYPSLFELGHRYRYGDLLLEPAGMLHYGYGRGFWDEWWCETDRGAGVWVSVDEGDFVMEQRQSSEGAPPLAQLKKNPGLKMFNTNWIATEFGEASFEGMAGAVPEVVKPGRTFHYVHLSAPGRQLITLEYDDPQASPDVYLGEWMDPFLIEVC